jgi:hypothetical protein
MDGGGGWGLGFGDFYRMADDDGGGNELIEVYGDVRGGII